MARSGATASSKIAILLLLLILGAIEGWFTRTDFATDAISYLDISRAIPADNWKLIFNPLWSVGYPLLLSILRPLFPKTPGGEWVAIHVLNVLIFLATWTAFNFLLESPLLESPLFEDSAKPLEEIPEARRGFLRFAALFVFIAIQLCIDSVSRVGPDLLVTMFFFLSVAIMLRLLHRPGLGRAIALGCVLGLGYWVKGIFLALSLAVLAVTTAALLWKKRSLKPALLSLAIFVLIALPYAAGLSWSFGRFTLGESGTLNYAFHVNLLPHWTNWQGGPIAAYGLPIHPTHQVLKHPSLFVFGEPYRNTYPPFGNIAYWYQGYRHFFSPRLQAVGILRDLYYLAQLLFKQPIFYAVLLASVLLWIAVEDKRAWLTKTLRAWPLFTPALLGIAFYVVVHLEGRYLGSFLAILCLLPFATLCLLDKMPSRKIQIRALTVLAVGAALNLAVVDRPLFQNLRHHSIYSDDPEWRLGMDLRQMGLKRGDAIASVGGPNASSTWAYIDGLRIVAELGGQPFDPRNPSAGAAENDAAAPTFWRDPPAVQQKILSLFRAAGAIAVTAPGKPPGVGAPGWQRAKDTNIWVYRF